MFWGQKICHHVAEFGIPFNDMQYDHVWKKMDFDLLTQTPGSGIGSLLAIYLLPCCCIRDFTQFDMQHDNVL